jgi:tetratricopeptide (TPR) repeat protein
MTSRVTGHPLSPHEVAEQMNAYLYERGRVAELDANYINKLERGVIRWPSSDYRLALRAVLGAATDLELGFTPPRRGSGATRTKEPTTEPYPRTSAAGIVAVTGLWRADLEGAEALRDSSPDAVAWDDASLQWLLSAAVPEPVPAGAGTRRVGASDVDAVRTTVNLFANMDNLYGGAHARLALVQFLTNEGTSLLNGQYNDETGRSLFSAVAEATLLSAWMSYDAGLHGIAQRYFLQALRLAQSGDDRRLAGSIMAAMSHQATFLGDFQEATNLARTARAGTGSEATATLTALFHAQEARALARLGAAAGCDRALASATRIFERQHPDEDPEWINYFNESELAAEIGHCMRDLGRARQAREHAAQAVSSADGKYVRSDFFAMLVLADVLLDGDEPEEGCRTALAALDLGKSLRSARTAEYLREFRQRLARYEGSPAIRDFAEQAAESSLWTSVA